MKATALWWMIGTAIGAGVAATLAGQGPDVLLGVTAPALAAGVSWVAMVGAWRGAPEALLPLMLKAFPAKVLFFVGYVALVLGLLDVQLVPFVGSFVGAFLATHLTEAFYLRRLLATVLHDTARGSDTGSPVGRELRDTGKQRP